MAYDIFYYADRAMTRRTTDLDKLGSLDRYPAPTGREVAEAVNVDDRRLTRYGYDGAWHVSPPQEALCAGGEG